MPTAKSRSDLPTVTDDAPRAAAVAVLAYEAGPVAATIVEVEVEALDAADEDPYSNVACTD